MPSNPYKGRIKGGNHKENVILSGVIEPKVQNGFFGNKIVDIEERFIAKRKISGKTINGRVIKGWKEVPIVKDWRSTYRYTKWTENFKKLGSMLENKPLSEIFNTGDLNKSEKEFNNALCVFINSYFFQQMRYRENEDVNIEELIYGLSLESVNHSKSIYLNDDYKDRDSHKLSKVELNEQEITLKYDEYRCTTYEQIVDLFFDYLDTMEKMRVDQVNLVREQNLVIDPKHRWQNENTKKMLAKFKDLSESRFGNMWTTMLTLTTYQDKNNDKPETPENWDKNRGASWFEAMERLKDSLDKILKVLREVARREIDTTLHYVWVVEAHKSGYPHIHIAIFGDVSEWLNDYTNELRIKEILEEEHDLGKTGVATEFDTKPPSGDGTINELSNYLMKYFSKNFGEIKSKYEDESLEDKEWGTIVYNACMWLSGYRTWGTSKEVGNVMKTEKSESDKEYNHMGGRTTNLESTKFGDIIKRSGDEKLKNRIENRELFREAIKERKNL